VLIFSLSYSPESFASSPYYTNSTKEESNQKK
jgi:hypothetical protein